jgi:hypothetical protein
MTLYTLEYTFDHKIIFVYSREAPLRGSSSYIGSNTAFNI